MALTQCAEGTSEVIETIFENRFMHVTELQGWEQILISSKIQLLLRGDNIVWS